MIYDIYFWWKGWNKVSADSYKKKDVYVFPPTPSRGWIIIGCSYTPRNFREVRRYLKAIGL